MQKKLLVLAPTNKKRAEGTLREEYAPESRRDMTSEIKKDYY